MSRVMAGLLGIIIAAFTADIPKEAQEAFAKATEFDLYSLDPSKETKSGFHGWAILGKTSVKGELAKKVREAIEQGISENRDTKGGCFLPRHGIRINGGKKPIDLVISFQCLYIYVFEGEKQTGWTLTSSSPDNLINQVLTDAKVPLPEK